MPDFAYLKTSKAINKKKVREFFRTTENFFAVLDRDAIISKIQVKAALEHLSRPRKVRVRDNATLLMMFLSGHSQITKAMDSVGVTERTRNLMVIYEDLRDFKTFSEYFPELAESDQPSLPEDVPELDRLVFGRMAQVELELW